MKKVMVLVIMVTNIGIVFCQNEKKENFRKALNSILNQYALNSEEFKFTSYSKNDDLCFDVEESLNIYYDDFLLIKEDKVLNEKSQETVLSYLKSIANYKFLTSAKKDCEYKNINFKILYIFNDYKKIYFKYFVNIERLISISNNFNRADAEFILMRD
jgi:hypothetical protein